MIHACSEGRLLSIKRQLVQADGTETSNRQQKRQRVNVKYESVRAFLSTYFSPENGRCEKLPNPRFGRDEYRLPIWLTKKKLYRVYCADAEACGGKPK